MYDKIIKLMPFFYLIGNAFINLSCYTVIKNLENVKPTLQDQFPNDSIIDSKLFGTWTKEVLWMDYGYQIQKFEFSNGKVVYIPSSERSNSKVFTGNYRTISDTLLLKFEGVNYIGYMIYKITGNNLFLNSIAEKPVKINFWENCDYCAGNWIKTVQ